jgi:fatty acid desaturase
MFRYKEDRLPVLLVLCLFGLDLTVYLTVQSPWLLLAWSAFSMLPKAGVCAYNHHHQHLSIFNWSLANRLFEFVLALETGITSQAWVLHHSLGHHLNYLDQTKDESRWARDDGSRMGEWEYTWATGITAYPRAWAVGARFPKERRIFVVMAVLTLALVAGLIAYHPLAGTLIFLVTPIGLLFGTALATWAHHSDRSTDNHFVASNNIIQTFYNAFTCNLGYHTAHHYKPGVHWSRLPQLHAEIASKIPPETYLEPGLPWRWFGKTWKPGQGEPSWAAAQATVPAEPALQK